MDLPTNLSPERQRLLAMRLRGAAPAAAAPPKIPRRPEGPRAPLSPAQHQLWVVDQIDPGNPAYNIPMAYYLTGEVDVPKLEESFNVIIARHEAWRTTFHTAGGDAVQEIHPPGKIRISLVSLEQVPENERRQKVQPLCAQEAVKSFDLRRWPLLRVTLFRLEPAEHVLFINLHHIIADGLSLTVLFRELDTIYRGSLAGTEPALPALAVQYADVAVWQLQELSTPRVTAQLAYWSKHLAGELPVLSLSTDRPRPRHQSFRGASVDFELSAELAAGVLAVAKREQCTFFVAILSAFQTILRRYGNGEAVIIGVPIVTRPLPEMEPLLGYFLNMIALRGDLSGDPTFLELLRRNREVAMDAFSNQDVPFEKVVGQLQSRRDPSRNPVFQCMMQILPAVQARIGDLTLERFPFEVPLAQVDVTLHLYEEEGGGYHGQIQYATELYPAGLVEKLTANFVALLQALARQPELRLSSLVA